MNKKEKNEDMTDIAVSDSHAIATRSASLVRRALVGLSSADLERVATFPEHGDNPIELFERSESCHLFRLAPFELSKVIWNRMTRKAL